MIIKTNISDLHTAADLLYDYSFRRRPEPDSEATKRVADWLTFVAEQREEYEARKRTEQPRYASLKSGMQAVWAIKRRAA